MHLEVYYVSDSKQASDVQRRMQIMILSGIAFFYLICFGIGFLCALLGAIFGEIAGHMHFDLDGHHVELGHGEHGVGTGHVAEAGHEVYSVPGAEQQMPGASFFNTITMSTFLAFFGIAGLGAVWGLKLSPVASVLFAFPTAVIIAIGQFALFVKIFIKAQGSSEATMGEVLGCEADMLTGIPGDRMGQISYVIKGSRYNAPAVSEDGKDIARGTKVRIVNLKGNAFVVRPL